MSDKIKNGGPAFPIEKFPVKFDKKGYAESFKSYSGMTLRDYFAAKAMQGIIISMGMSQTQINDIVKWSYNFSDAMLEAREK